MNNEWSEIKCEECGRKANLYEQYFRGCSFSKQRTILCRYHKELSERFINGYYRNLATIYSDHPDFTTQYSKSRNAAEREYYKALKSAEESYNKAMDSAEKKYNARLYPYRKKIADIEEED